MSALQSTPPRLGLPGVVLQSSPPELGPPVAALLVLALAGSAVGALGSAVVQRLSNPVRRYRLLYGVVLTGFALVAYVVLSGLGLGPAVAGTVGVDPTGLPGTALSTLLDLLAAGLVWLAAYAPTVRGVRRERDVELSTPRAVARVARYVVAVCVVAAVAVVALRVAPTAVAPLVVVAVLAALGVLALVAAPWVLATLQGARQPTPAEADRVAALREAAGLDVRDVRVVETDEAGTASALVRGPPGYRRLLLSTTFLDRFDDDVAVALLAVRAGRLRSRLLSVQVGTVLAVGPLLVAAVAGVGPRWPLAVLAVVTAVGGLWASRRAVRAADDRAAGRVGAAAVADALQRYAAVHAVEPGRRRVPNPLAATPALGDRIDRLRDGTRTETGEGSSGESGGDRTAG